MKEKNLKEEYNLRLPAVILLAALLDSAGFLLPALYTYFVKGHIAIALIFTALGLFPSVAAIIVYRNRVIRFNRSSFSYRSVLGRTSHYSLLL